MGTFTGGPTGGGLHCAWHYGWDRERGGLGRSEGRARADCGGDIEEESDYEHQPSALLSWHQKVGEERI